MHTKDSKVHERSGAHAHGMHYNGNLKCHDDERAQKLTEESDRIQFYAKPSTHTNAHSHQRVRDAVSNTQLHSLQLQTDSQRGR